MRTLAPPTGRGWETLAGDDVWDWSTELAELPTLLAEKTKAPSVVAGPTDLVIDPTNWTPTAHLIPSEWGHVWAWQKALEEQATQDSTGVQA